MRQHREVELKWSLSEDGYTTLASRLPEVLGPALRLEQENRFFDSCDLRLRRALCNVRLRLENGRLLLTCKRRVATPDQAHRHDEWEAWLDGDLRQRIETPGTDLAAMLPLPDPVRQALEGAPLMPMGGFANLRLEFHDGDHLLCLDRTSFPGGRIDHELEIETSRPADADARWSARLDQWGVPHQHQPLTKFARYLGIAAP
jgi:uncharacterized protein YjbK